MKLKAVSGIMLTLMLTSMLTLAFNIQPVKSDPKIIRVPTDYPTIQEAIDAGASPGDAIYVYSGTYHENVIVNKPVSLIGEDKDTTVIDGNGSLRVVAIYSDGVSISGFTVMHSYGEPGWGGGGLVVGGVGNVQISDIIACDNDADWGVHLNPNSHDVNITRTVIVNNSRGGLMLHRTWKVKVSNNIITNNAYWAGVRLSFSSNNTVSGNTITNNDYGIHLLDASNNRICGNKIADSNYTGIHLDWFSNFSNYNIISGNNIRENGCGIGLSMSSNNSIYHNNFLDNAEQVYGEASTNVWDDGYPSGGNYWSDHNPPDLYSDLYQNETGRDGIGDIPYVIDENNKDRYPLIYPYGYVPSPDLIDDGIVDIMDVVIAAVAFGSYPGHPRWNPIADIKQDGLIDIFDLVIIGVNFGKRL